ncbi:hypothetical protein GCM10028796_21000 [Ramlibacter monticola]
MTGPQWTDVLRTVPGARLRLSLALKPAWRELLQRWLSTRGLELEPLEGAAAEVVRLDAQGGLLRLCAASTDIEVELHHGDDGVPALRGRARHGSRDWSFDVPRLSLQRAGSREAFVSRTVDGARLPWLKFSHARDGQGFAVTVFPGAIEAPVSSGWRALLPSAIELLSVRIEA